MNEGGENDQSLIEKASLWKKKQSIVEPNSVYDQDERQVVGESGTPKESVLADKPCDTLVETKRKETNRVEMPPPSRPSRETFKQRAQQRQREIEQMRMMLKAHQPSQQHLVVSKDNDHQGKIPETQQQEPFDFERMEKEKEIESRFSQFCRTHNKLSKKPTGLLRASLLQYEENSKRRFQPSCKSRRLQSESGSLSLISKTPQQLQRILVSLDEKCRPSEEESLDLMNNSTTLQTDNVVESPMIFDYFQKAPPSSSFPIINPSNCIDFDEGPFDNKKTYTVIRTGSSTIQFTQWKSVFSKNNK